MTIFNYKGYPARVEFDDDSDTFHGEVVGIRDVVTFEGRSVAQLRKAFRDSVEDYLAFCAERGEEPAKPCSGKFMLRISPELHRHVSSLAEASGKSLNAWVSECLERSIQR